MESVFQIVYKGEHTLLAALREILFYIEFSYRHSKYSVYCSNGSLPPWLVFLGTAHYLAELKSNGTEIIAEHIGSAVDHAKLCIVFEGLERYFLQDFLNLVELLRLAYGDVIDLRIAEALEYFVPHDSREILLEVCVCHLVEVVRDVAEFGP